MTTSEDNGCKGLQQPLEEGGCKGNAESPQGKFFFARLLKADLPLFVKCTLQDALLDAFYSFGFPVCHGRVASLFSSLFQCCLHLCTNSV